MDDNKDKNKNKLSLSKPGKLEIRKTVEGGQVRQKFSHGRSKVVTVEVKKKRTFAPSSGGDMAEVKPTTEIDIEESQVAEADETLAQTETVESDGDGEGGLTEQERAVRASALEEALRKDEEENKSTVEKEKSQEEAPKTIVEEVEIAAVNVDLEKEAPTDLEKTDSSPPTPANTKFKSKKGVSDLSEIESEDEAKKGKLGKKVPASIRRDEPRRRSGKLTIADALDETERVRSLASLRRAREKKKKREGPIEHTKVFREVTIPETITVQQLANRMAERGTQVVSVLMNMGVMANIQQSIDGDTAQLVAEELGHQVKRVSESDVEIGLEGGVDTEEQLVARPAIVTVMGHVDHGKTSLLDALRETSVVAGEAGGITQHIGAYQIQTDQGSGRVTLIDTPGHQAFTEMRSRGASVTDIVVLVVAANDGIMPQTVEAIDHSRAAGAPIIIAINKIDLPESDPNKVRTQLLEHEIVTEAMGGDVLDVEVSALQKMNLDKLVELIALQAEILDLKANPNRAAEGSVIESKLEQGRGPVATILVKKGTLRIGDVFVAGSQWGRVRSLVSDTGSEVSTAGPSDPVEVVGLNGSPNPGDIFVVVDSESRAREIAEFRENKNRAIKTAVAPQGTLDEMFSAIKSGESKELQLVIKGDVQGSVEAIIGLIKNLDQEEVKVRILHQGVGGISKSDVQLANASGGVVFGFNVRANKQAMELSEAEGVDIRYYSVIYDLAEDIKGLVIGLMKPEKRESFLGNAEIREVFRVSKLGNVAGCFVVDGSVKRGAGVRLIRDDVVIHEGSLSTLKRFKDDVREVQQNYECGMSFENYDDIKIGDVIECFEVEEFAPQI